jgi:hypothetical protein
MLVDKFIALIKSLVGQDTALADIITCNNDDIRFVDNTLIFTISGLYHLISDTRDMTYIEFRTTLYQGNLNQELGKLGYKVVISDSTGNIDTSWYQLRPLEVV